MSTNTMIILSNEKLMKIPLCISCKESDGFHQIDCPEGTLSEKKKAALIRAIKALKNPQN